MVTLISGAISCLPSPMEHHLDVAQVYESLEKEKCGHRVKLAALVARNMVDCPLCKSPILFVCDEGSGAKFRFKYGKQMYELSAEGKPWWFSRNSAPILVQQRILCVLGLVDGWKILAKGKVLYPNPKLTAGELSKLLMEVSLNDPEGKSSLVVMGTRAGQQLIEQRGMLNVVLGNAMTFFWAFVTGIYHFLRPLPPPHRSDRAD